MGIFDFFKFRKSHQEPIIDSPDRAQQHNYGVCDTPLDANYTPDDIVWLGRRDIFVFGSNIYGYHIGGAAESALNRFGAIWGQGEGLQGNSYAIPTMLHSVDAIKQYVDRFTEFAEYEKALTFYVTKIGCGVAGHSINNIAPLFRNAYHLPNVRLPKEFVAYIERDNIPDDNFSCDITTHCYGITRTFADIILGLNHEKKYASPEQVLSDLDSYLDRFQEHGDNVAFLAERILRCILNDKSEIFKNGHLNESLLREIVFNEHNFIAEYDKAYDMYCREKLMNLISYLNEFRRYSTCHELIEDLSCTTYELSFLGCVSISMFDYFRIMGDTRRLFNNAIHNLWPELTTDGILDADKMRIVMFWNHEESIKRIGLQATIQKDFIQESPCYPEIYIPKVTGTAPVYIEDITGGYRRSCGNGHGPISIPNWFEFQIAKQILENDKSYTHIGDYYIPKYDNTLPVYGEDSGRIVFSSKKQKLKFIDDVKRGCIYENDDI